MGKSRLGAAAIGAVTALGIDRALRSRPGRFAAMSGSSIADPSSVGFITDFLNAAYYAKRRDLRDLDDLRLAFCIITTRWSQLGRRLTASDVVGFHRAYFTGRWRTEQSPRGTLTTEQLLEGAAALLGDWFPDAQADPERRGWGIAFPTASAKAQHDPEVRLAAAKLGPLTPPSEPTESETRGGQTWHTYPPVPVEADPGAVAQALLAVEAWPDYGSELGRFTPLRQRGLDGQTFEIEVVGFPTSRTPLFLRAYVTITTLVTPDDPGALRAYVDDVNAGWRRFAPHEEPPVPEDADPVAAFDLTCHEGHFMGNAKNRLFLYRQGDRSYLRAAGTWDQMDWLLAQVYSRAGRYAQHAFWGMESPRESMLHQIAAAVEGQAPAPTGAAPTGAAQPGGAS